MDILIIGNDNPEIVDKILELISDTNITVKVSKSFEELDNNLSLQLSMLDVSLSSELIKGNDPVIAVPRHGKSGIRGFIEDNIMLHPKKIQTPPVMIIDDLFNDYEPTIENFRRLEPPIPIQPYIEDYELEFGYGHTTGKRLYIKRQEDINNTRCLSVLDCNQNKSLLKQHNINQKLVLCRKHGIDNRM